MYILFIFHIKTKEIVLNKIIQLTSFIQVEVVEKCQIFKMIDFDTLAGL